MKINVFCLNSNGTASCMYIEIIQTFEIEQIITDTIWIYITVSHFFIRRQTKGTKNAAL